MCYPNRRIRVIVGGVSCVIAALFLQRYSIRLTAADISTDKPSSARVSFNLSDVLSLERMKPAGKWYESIVPNTLDLAERTELSINALTGDVDPDRYYGVYQGFKFDSNPPHVTGSDILYGLTLTARNVRTLPMLRAMNGSDYKLEIEYGMMRALMSRIRKDGRLYYPGEAGSPAGNTAYPFEAGMLAFAMENWYYRDRNPAWLDWIDLLARGLRGAVIHAGDRAYYPLQTSIDPQGKWHDLVHGEKGLIPYHSPDEPVSDQQGIEGTAKNDQTRPLSTLVYDYKLTGNEESLRLAREIARYILRPQLWFDTSVEGSPGNEHAVFSGHFHANVHTLIALLDLAEAEHDDGLGELVREGYNQALRYGVVRIGWFPAVVMPEQYHRPAWLGAVAEGCGVADMIVLGTRLTDTGLGDYWDDVDSIVRNQLVAQQISDLDLMRQISAGGTKNDALLKEYLGGFGLAGVNGAQCDIAGCCTGNSPQGLYYAWHGITRFNDGVATVNLFLNRASPWMDVDSYVPYEGKVILHNKQAHTALVRIPEWVEEAKLASFVNDSVVEPAPAGRYVVFDKLKPGDQIRLQFPIRESSRTYTIAGKVYTATFRGSTALDITPHDASPSVYPMYRREYFRSDTAPMKKVRRFVADQIIPLGVY
jgi:hypothetical protein